MLIHPLLEGPSAAMHIVLSAVAIAGNAVHEAESTTSRTRDVRF